MCSMTGSLDVRCESGNYINNYSPVADRLMFVTSTVTSIDNGSLKTSTGCINSSSSATLYNVLLKNTVISA